MIIIYRINDDNVKSINDLIYFYYSMLTANAYMDGEIRIYTTFNYYEFFSQLPFEFYPDFRDKETFKNDVLSAINNYILIEDSKKMFYQEIEHTNHMSIFNVLNAIRQMSIYLFSKLQIKIAYNSIIFI